MVFQPCFNDALGAVRTAIVHNNYFNGRIGLLDYRLQTFHHKLFMIVTQTNDRYKWRVMHREVKKSFIFVTKIGISQ